jgi:hypothetical protein
MNLALWIVQGLFLQLIGVCEVLGAMVVKLASSAGARALTPAIVGLMAALVAYGRWRLSP